MQLDMRMFHFFTDLTLENKCKLSSNKSKNQIYSFYTQNFCSEILLRPHIFLTDIRTDGIYPLLCVKRIITMLLEPFPDCPYLPLLQACFTRVQEIPNSSTCLGSRKPSTKFHLQVRCSIKIKSLSYSSIQQVSKNFKYN